MITELWCQCRHLPAVSIEHVLPVLDAFRARNQVSAQQQREAATRLKPLPIRVLGYQKELKFLEKQFRLTMEYRDVIEMSGQIAPSRILLFGPPRCGKTWLVKAIAQKYSLSSRTITRADVFSKYFGESEIKLKEIFDEVS